MDWLKNLYQQYLQSDIPAATLLRGDTNEFLPSVNRNLNQNLSLLSTPEGAMDLVNPMAKVSGLLGTIGKKLPFDPRFDQRVLEQEKLINIKPQVESYNIQENIPKVSLTDYEGKPFITSMSDRTSAQGLLTGVNNVTFNNPIPLQGGQGYMFLYPDQLWASGKQPVKHILDQAEIIKSVTGQNPLYIPWRMSPTGGDFSHMTGETMLAYAESNMPTTFKTKANKMIKDLIPDWKGLSNPKSMTQYSYAPDKVRKKIQLELDKQFRDVGGLGRGEARLAVADSKQLTSQEGGIQNIGEIFTGKEALYKPTEHKSYPYVVQGRGIGELKENKNIFELLPEVQKARNIIDPSNPTQQDIRALQMKPYSGTLTADLLKRLGF